MEINEETDATTKFNIKRIYTDIALSAWLASLVNNKAVPKQM